MLAGKVALCYHLRIMGLTYVTAEIGNLAKNLPPFTAEFLVDKGAVDCMIPASELHRAGVEIEDKRVYELADNSVVEYPVGYARVRFMGDQVITQVIFGPEGCEPILGVVALEMTGILVDPRTNNLKRMPAIPLK